MNPTRLDRLTSALQRYGVAGLVLMPAANLTYLSSLTFHPGKRLTLALIPTTGPACMIVPALEANRVAATSRVPLRLFPWSDAEGPTEATRLALAAAFGPQRDLVLAVEYSALRVMELRALEAAWPGLQVVDATDLMAELRMVKDAEEVAIMERAAQIVETGLAETIRQIRVGMTERQISRMLSAAIIAAGAEGESFENMVASGPNGANPHHSNGDRVIQPGDLIILDCGARYQGYISDTTRTVAVGEPSAAARQIYELVRAANAAGRAAARPGATPSQIDAATRQVIAAAGYGDAFIHRTGHGIGIEVHELPNILDGNNTPLVPGTTFTIEPGIYLPGNLGVRIEDDMLITPEGARSLTQMGRELQIVGGFDKLSHRATGAD
ncbi:peptidase M24 [Oscillochloris trichoides DG-6]|uniref:Peptidase M24 n=1 Tax=Oscillochloris trichoides DG-6 TaxID=765420 RepID=E1IEW3_9CHLR|nr:Xaa-Pro peptidase family protein [Oscillochloris trichoides]EFO80260.1 peptidase M24 [Oscillochloris trichoides DG-6]